MSSSGNPNNIVGRSFSNPVPIDIVESWLKGEYLVGLSDSIGYDYIGWSLMIRGMYAYVVLCDPEKNDVPKGAQKKLEEKWRITVGPSRPPRPRAESGILSHAGICTIDIKNGDLVYQGVRLYTNKEFYSANRKEESKNTSAPNAYSLFWRSMFSKLTRINKDKDPHAYFGSVLYEPSKDKVYKGIQEVLCTEISKDWMGGTKGLSVLDMLLGCWPENERQLCKGFGYKTPEKKALSQFQKKAVEYLDENFPDDLVAVVNGAAEDKGDDVGVLLHMDLGAWTKKKNRNTKTRRGEFQTVTLNDGLLPKNVGEIYWFPLEA